MHTPAAFSAKAASAMRSLSRTVENALCSGTRRARLIVRKSRRGTSAPPTPCHCVDKSVVSTLCRISLMCRVRSSISLRCTSIFFRLRSISFSSARRRRKTSSRSALNLILTSLACSFAIPSRAAPRCLLASLLRLRWTPGRRSRKCVAKVGMPCCTVVVCGVMGGSVILLGQWRRRRRGRAAQTRWRRPGGCGECRPRLSCVRRLHATT